MYLSNNAFSSSFNNPNALQPPVIPPLPAVQQQSPAQENYDSLGSVVNASTPAPQEQQEDPYASLGTPIDVPQALNENDPYADLGKPIDQTQQTSIEDPYANLGTPIDQIAQKPITEQMGVDQKDPRLATALSNLQGGTETLQPEVTEKYTLDPNYQEAGTTYIGNDPNLIAAMQRVYGSDVKGTLTPTNNPNGTTTLTRQPITQNDLINEYKSNMQLLDNNELAIGKLLFDKRLKDDPQFKQDMATLYSAWQKVPSFYEDGGEKASEAIPGNLAASILAPSSWLGAIAGAATAGAGEAATIAGRKALLGKALGIGMGSAFVQGSELDALHQNAQEKMDLRKDFSFTQNLGAGYINSMVAGALHVAPTLLGQGVGKLYNSSLMEKVNNAWDNSSLGGWVNEAKKTASESVHGYLDSLITPQKINPVISEASNLNNITSFNTDTPLGITTDTNVTIAKSKLAKLGDSVPVGIFENRKPIAAVDNIDKATGAIPDSVVIEVRPNIKEAPFAAAEAPSDEALHVDQQSPVYFNTQTPEQAASYEFAKETPQGINTDKDVQISYKFMHDYYASDDFGTTPDTRAQRILLAVSGENRPSYTNAQLAADVQAGLKILNDPANNGKPVHQLIQDTANGNVVAAAQLTKSLCYKIISDITKIHADAETLFQNGDLGGAASKLNEVEPLLSHLEELTDLHTGYRSTFGRGLQAYNLKFDPETGFPVREPASESTLSPKVNAQMKEAFGKAIPKEGVSFSDKFGGYNQASGWMKDFIDMYSKDPQVGILDFKAAKEDYTLSEKVAHIARSFMLSSPHTWILNVLNFPVMEGLELGKDSVHALVNNFLPKEAKLAKGEWLAHFHGVYDGFKEMLGIGMKSFIDNHSYVGQSIWQKAGAPINNAIINMPSRAIITIEGMTKVLFTGIDLWKQAAVLAEKENAVRPFASNEEWSNFMRDFVTKAKAERTNILNGNADPTDPHVQAYASAMQRAKVLNFTSSYSDSKFAKGTQLIMQGANTLNPLIGTTIDPFARFQTNMLEVGLQHSPIGTLWASERKALAGGMGKKAQAEAYIKQVFGWGLFLSGWALAENGLYQGALPGTPEQQRFERDRGLQVNSAIIDNKSYELHALSPIVTPLSLGATYGPMVSDFLNGKLPQQPKGKQDMMTTIIGMVADSFGQIILSSTGFQGIARTIDGLSTGKGFSGLGKSAISAGTPNILNDLTNMTDPTFREAQGLLDFMHRRLPGREGELYPHVDMYGQSIHLATEYKLFNPIHTDDIIKDPVYNETARLGIGEGVPTNKFMSTIELNKEQQYDFAILKGRLRYYETQQLISSPAWNSGDIPDGIKRRLLTSIGTKSTKSAAGLLLVLHPSLLEGKTEQQLDDLMKTFNEEPEALKSDEQEE